MALQLFFIARISFRAVSRVLEVLSCFVNLAKAPCPQTVINWVARLSIARMQDIAYAPCPSANNGCVYLLDASIGLGQGKILAVLALDGRHHALCEGASALQNLTCVGVAVAPSWTGETVADLLQKITNATGQPVAYLKDGGTDLGKAMTLLSERGFSSLAIDDISHTIANLLRHEYQNHPKFNLFLSACGQVSKKLKQTLLACLAPPKISNKARFMNLHHLVKWADQLLKHSPKGRAAKGSVLEKLRAGLGQMPSCKRFITHFLRDATPLLACQKILKNKGLSLATYQECQPLLNTIPNHSSVRIGFINWAEKQLVIAKKLGLDQCGMPISSDGIESLFGTAKQHGTSKIKDANRIALRIPTLCGPLTRKDAQRVLDISVKDQQDFFGHLPSLISQRRQILPNPGCDLEGLLITQEKQDLELIPPSKIREKNTIIQDISVSCGNCTEPAIGMEIPIPLPP